MNGTTLFKTASIATVGAFSITLGTVHSAHAANLVVNGGFETGDFTGWTQAGYTSGYTRVSSNNPNSGIYSARLGPPVGSLGFLSQTLTTTVGQAYELSYFLFSDGATPNVFQTLVNGTPIFAQNDIPAQPYAQYNLSFVGTGSDEIKFGFQNDPGYLYLDDVSVSVVPVPTPAVPVPTPALLPGLIGMGVAAWRKRKAEMLTEV